MSREKKSQTIERLQQTLAKSRVGVLIDYRGLATAEMTNLRRKLQESGCEYKVVKNTLARFAAERAGKTELGSSFSGPIAIAFGYGAIAMPAKVVTDYLRETQASLSIKGGFLDNHLLTSEEIITLATLPSREVLLARALGQMKSPLAALLGCLSSPISSFIGVLQARIKQLEV